MINPIFRAVSDSGRLDFKQTVINMLTLGEDNETSQGLRAEIKEYTNDIQGKTTVGLTKADVDTVDGPFYSWQCQRMLGELHDSQGKIIGKQESLRSDLLKACQLLGVDVTAEMLRAIQFGEAVNVSLSQSYQSFYDKELVEMVKKYEGDFLNRHHYQFESTESGDEICHVHASEAKLTTLLDGLVQVIDDFHTDPIAVRKIALQQEYHKPPAINGKAVGGLAYRVDCPEELKSSFLRKLGRYFPSTVISSSCIQFRYTLADTQKRAVCHADGVDYAGICYLSNPEHNKSGTVFYRHKPTGELMRNKNTPEKYDYSDPEQWEEISRVDMKFNRLVFYPGDLFHSIATPFFGKNIDDARLTQNMFINFES
jgi:hypothetical protein